MPSCLTHDSVKITGENIDEVRNSIHASDQQEEIKIDDVISHWVVQDERGQGHDYTAWHNQGRIACELGGDSLWAEWKDDQYKNDSTRVLLDYGWYVDFDSNMFDEDGNPR